MNYVVDLDILMNESISGSVVPMLYRDLENKHNRRGSSSKLYQKDVLTHIQRVYSGVICTSEPEQLKRDNKDSGNPLSILIKLSHVTNMYNSYQKFIKNYKDYMGYSEINVMCMTAHDDKLTRLNIELIKLQRYKIFDSIEMRRW